MRRLFLRPNDPLAPYVAEFWYLEAGPAEASQQPDAILPNGSITLVFNLSDRPHRQYASNLDQFKRLRTRWLSGIRDDPVIVGPSGGTNVLGIRFKPGGLAPFVSAPCSEFARDTVDADAIWGERACVEIHQRLLEQATATRQLELLERWLIGHFNQPSADEGILRSLALLERSAGQISIDRLARVADLSPRHYRRRVLQIAGLSPKRLASVLRFGNVVRRIGLESSAVQWGALALDSGYYDQAHMIAAFQEFAGVSPGEYVRRKPTVPGFLPIEVPMAVFSNTRLTAPHTI